MRSIGDGDGRGIARQSATALKLNSIGSMAQASRRLGPLSAGGIASGLRAQRRDFALPELRGQGVSKAESAQSKMGAIDGTASILVNFAPTVVLQSGADLGELERRVIQAIGRHSHELVRIISRELQSKRRAAF
jgi:hypothetical protein